jgi:hypothetical protein
VFCLRQAAAAKKQENRPLKKKPFCISLFSSPVVLLTDLQGLEGERVGAGAGGWSCLLVFLVFG